jgi:hypothetical protein
MGTYGFKRDDRAAYFWAVLAERVHLTGATAPAPGLVARLRQRLSPEQIAGAEADAESWLKEHPLSSEGWDLVELSSATASLAARR